jgi:hypothetical protein
MIKGDNPQRLLWLISNDRPPATMIGGRWLVGQGHGVATVGHGEPE